MKLSVLLVEDNPLNQELARDLLELAGHQVAVAADGGELRSIVARHPALSIVLMDVLLPDADGVTLMLELRAIAEYRLVPIVAVTAQALAGDRQRFLSAGFDAVLTKPIDTRTFVSEVERCAQKV